MKSLRHMLHEGRWINKGIKWHRHFYINKQNIHGYLSESIKKKIRRSNEIIATNVIKVKIYVAKTNWRLQKLIIN